MHSAEKNNLTSPSVIPQRIGLIAGGGKVPDIFVRYCEQNNIDVTLVALKSFADPDLLENRKGFILPLGSVGAILSCFRSNNIKDLVLLGTLSRPEDYLSLKPDARGLMMIAKIALKSLGDDGLLRLIRQELEQDGFSLWGAHSIMPSLLISAGVHTNTIPSPLIRKDFDFALPLLLDHARKDLGQSLVVQNETILGYEDQKGTDSLIVRAYQMGHAIDQRPILVKICKPQQDPDLDMPTIGTKTIELCAQHGFAGIYCQADFTLIPEKDKVIELCNQHGLFLQAIECPR
jgi:UDP-2,3-diacylglucosamine hydrolase